MDCSSPATEWTMSIFPTRLPKDIVLTIFLYLEKKDTVECMRVCRQWYSEIPLYATDLWKSINISSTSLNKPNDCELRCLGPHVKHVLINEQGIYGILKRLKSMDCELAEMEITQVKHDETSSICSETKLLSSISLFCNTLKILVIINYCSNVSPLQLLSSLPNLTHLSLTTHDRVYGVIPPHDDINCNTSNLVYLNLGYTLNNFNHRIMPLLRRCPNLKVLILTRASTMAETSPFPGDWNQILQLCPRLHYFRLDGINTPQNIKDITALTTKFNDNKGIRKLVFRDNVDEINSISNLLSRLDQLEDLKLTNRNIFSNQWNSLTHVHFPRLKTMTLHNLLVRNDDWKSFCACRPNLVSFVYKQMCVNGLDMDSMMAAVSCLKHLEHLNVLFFLSTMMNQIPNRWNNIWMLSSNTRLQKLELTGVRFAENAFWDLCRLPSLKELYVSLWPFHDDIRFDELLAFADRMKNTGIEKLALLHFNFLYDKVLERLGQATTLSMLCVLGCNSITDAGVVAFIRAKKIIDVNDCRLVSRNGVWTHHD